MQLRGAGGLAAYLGLDVVERRWADDGETDQEDVCLGVGEWAESVIILLTSGIPKTKADGLPINHDAGGVVVEAMNEISRVLYIHLTSSCLHCRDIFPRERVRGI